MKTRSLLALLGLGLAGGLFAGAGKADAAVAFSAGLEIRSPGDFYQPLAPEGAWVEAHRYGRCWHPSDVAAGWRPYCEGSWEWTDCGWYWQSDEPWAWACYHYGYWVEDPEYGWVWVPGTDWAPAWVVWRESPDYIGWAPCGPGGAVVAPSLFMFVDVHHFHDRIEPGHVIVNNTTIINRTRVISNITRENRSFGGTTREVVVNRGPGVETIQRATGAKFAARPIPEIVRRTPVPATVRRNREESFAQRPVQPEPRARTGRAEPEPRRGDSGARPQAQTPIQPQHPSQTAPPTTPAPEHRNPWGNTPPATGNQQPRVYREPPQPPLAPERGHVVPQNPPSRTPPQVPPPEQRPPPVGRERGNDVPREVPRRPEPGPTPEKPPAREVPRPPPAQDQKKDKDREQPPRAESRGSALTSAAAEG